MRRTIPLIGFLAFACGGTAEEHSAIKKQTTAMFSDVQFARASAEGVSVGFNIDGRVSDSRDNKTCGQNDYRSPDGVDGIDNQIAGLMPLLDVVYPDTVQGILTSAINEGRLLIFTEILETEDGKVELRIVRGEGRPLLGTDGSILPSQTLSERFEDSKLGQMSATRKGTTIEGGPVSLRIPFVIFNELYDLHLTEARVRFDLDEDGFVTNGVLGGSATHEQLLQVVQTGSDGEGVNLVKVVGPFLDQLADLDLDGNGTCDALSVAFTFKGVPAFLKKRP